jgi:hypothetical protein
VLTSNEYLSSDTFPLSSTGSTDSSGQEKFAGCKVSTEQAAVIKIRNKNRINNRFMFSPEKIDLVNLNSFSNYL